MSLLAVVAILVLPARLVGSAGQPPRNPPFAPAFAAGPARPTPVTAYDWAEVHRTPNLNGFTPNSTLSTASASGLGVHWATNLYGAALDSPVVAYDSGLGMTLAYVGTEAGNVLAVDLATGHVLWGTWLGSPVRSSPVVFDGAVYVGTFTNPAIYRLNASTGAIDCSIVSPRPVEGSPVIATPPHGVPTLFVGTEDSSTVQGATLAVNAANCSLEWSFSKYRSFAGSWVPVAYAVTAKGVPLVIFGTSDPDSAIYALNASSGVEVWRFQAANPSPGTYDIGAGAAISPPGANGFPAGAVFVPSKYGILYALRLNNGTVLWQTNFDKLVGVANGTEAGRSTPALDGLNLVLGTSEGLVDVNAATGKLLWKYLDPARVESVASPAIAGSHNTSVVATGDLAGSIDVVSLKSGAQLYTYSTGGYITSSPAISNGNIVIASSDGFLYDLAVGGGNEAVLPATSISSPLLNANLTNPNGNLTVAGNASDGLGVSSVAVALQSGGTGGPWWDATMAKWVPGPVANPAVLAHPGALATAWSLAYPVPGAGGTYHVTATASSTGGQSDIVSAAISFAVFYNTVGPHLEASPSSIAPGWGTTVNGGGFAPSETVALTLLATTVATLTATSAGALPATRVTIPLATAFGSTSLVATGLTSGRTTSAAITVANSWAQVGYDAGHSGYEPVDTALNFLVYPGGGHWVRLAWHFDAGAPVNASPAIADGVAYVASTAGTVDAVDLANGGLLWSWTSPAAVLDGSPAVNTTAKLVYVGGDDGNLTALSITTGQPVWTDALGGHVAAPVFAAGAVYATSSSGRVEAVDQSNGTVLWQDTFSVGIPAGPSLNRTAHVLVVGLANGNVTALNATTGATLWSYATGGAIVAAATISGGTVYVGSSDHSIYALSQAKGTKLWSYATGGVVADTGALSAHYTGGSLVLLIGSDDGNLYELYASSGLLKMTEAYHSPIVGVAAVEGIVVLEDAAGTIAASRTYTAIETMHYKTGAGLATAPAIVDGAIYVTGGDGQLYAFTTFGQAPD
jgi:outer membrane protein assembly factor BamB